MGSAPGCPPPAAARCSPGGGPRGASASSPPSARSSGVRDERFPRSVRLRKRSDYLRVQQAGRRLRTRHLLVLVAPGEAGRARFGITVSRKVGNAVTRNRVKRWLREAIRRHRQDLTEVLDIVFVAHPRAAEADYHRIEREVAQVFGRLQGGRT